MHQPCKQLHRAHIVASILLVLAACAPDLTLAQAASPFLTGATALQSNILILRCSGSENGGTSQFASRLIGEREILRRQVSRGSEGEAAFSARATRRSRSTSEQHVTEAAVMPSQIEQLPDLAGYLKSASSREWIKVSLDRSRMTKEHRHAGAGP
ncbi:MAG TPA: type IV secretion system DNA-binding domain-containing protein [Steroidobacteraceae bacterium]|nr:type IV secretion system DNA-binding domain-containing protein [Steroidobacteraceae bacterium]